jgi:site-specific DNA-methyltransferase (adenine-specific)
MPSPLRENTLFYGDNLPVLRNNIATESVDLIYLDPPFNSARGYNLLYQGADGRASDAQIQVFDDTWTWGPTTARLSDDLVQFAAPEVSGLLSALRQLLGTSPLMAYLVMMTARLVELHRVLKPTGSLYLHCDPAASHYLKIVLDGIFGPERFQNEIIWKRSHAHNSGRMFGPVHDVILAYTRSSRTTWNPQYTPLDPSYVASHYSNTEPNGRRYKRQDLTGAGVRNGETGKPWRGIDPTPKGRHWMRPPADLEVWEAEGRIYWPQKTGAWPYLKLYLDERPGMLVQDLWDDIDPINPVARERLGYPTQKPLALLERIISASSNPGDVVLDPFCGCGTAIDAAQRLGRQWIGIDVTILAIDIIKSRLAKTYPGLRYQVHGEPVDYASAQRLAQDDRYQFQWWALTLINGRPLGAETGKRNGKKGADRGVDGVIPFSDEVNGAVKRVVVQVKSGKVNSGDIRDLIGTVQRENAPIGVFLTLEAPSREMEREAASAGMYHSPGWGQRYPRIQLLTIEALLHGATVQMPPPALIHKAAQRVQPRADQGALPLDELTG